MENNEENKKKPLNGWRVFFPTFYFLVGILVIFLFKKDLFYFTVKKDNWNIFRFIWCFASSCIGFSAIAWQLRKHNKSPFPAYITHYPLQLIAMSALIYALLHLSEKTSNFVFYYLSFAICFTLGYLVDSYWSFVTSTLDFVKHKLPK